MCVCVCVCVWCRASVWACTLGTDNRSIQIWIDWQVRIDTGLTDGDAPNLSSSPLALSIKRTSERLSDSILESQGGKRPRHIFHRVLITVESRREDELSGRKAFPQIQIAARVANNNFITEERPALLFLCQHVTGGT